jgi:hypothetical protein
MSGLGGNGDTGNEPDLSLGEGEPDSGGADLSTDNDTGYESGSMEETALKTLREIQARGGDEADEGDEGDGKTIKVKEHVRKVKGGAGDGAAPEIDPATGKPKAAAAPPGDAPHKVLPTTWKRELATEFGKLPEAVQQEIHRRETDARNGVAMYRKDAEFARDLANDLIVPYQRDFAAVGQAPKEAVKQVMDTWSGLVRATASGDKAAAVGIFSQMLQGFGITASDLADPRDGGQIRQGSGDDPRLSAALQRVEQLERNIQSQEQQREQAEIATMATEFARFRADPKHEFVDTVQPIMQRLILAGEAANYGEAYDKACLLDANVRAKLDERKAAEIRNRETAGAAAARKAAGVRLPSRGLPSQAPKPGTMDDTLRETLRQINSR